jgi:hypothetical protein
MNATPAGNEPHRPAPADGTLAPTAPGTPPTKTALNLTKPQKILIGIIGAGVLTIATLGFIGSYDAVTELAREKHFGGFARAFPVAVDAGIIAFLALDLLLTWLRMSFPVLRYGAWLLTAATIAFNAATAYPDKLGMGMHGVIPLLFVIAVEAARHAVGRIADITADKHMEGPPVSCWFLKPVGTFILWRRQRLWAIRKWDDVLSLERERRIFIGQLRKDFGRLGWRRKATADKLLVLRLATKDGLSITDALALPEEEAAKQLAEAQRIADEKREAENARRREQEAHAREQKRLDDEAASKADADRIANERESLALAQEKADADRQQRIADAEAQARLDEIARTKRDADEAADFQRQQTQAAFEREQEQQRIANARRIADEQQRAADAARRAKDAAEAARIEAERKEAAATRAAQAMRAATANQTPASRPATASTPAATPAASASANTPTGSANRSASNPRPATASPANSDRANTSHSPATSASPVDIDHVVDVYQLLKQQDGKAPSDATLGKALDVSRSRAQQLRTLAVEAGHTDLAKPVRLAS